MLGDVLSWWARQLLALIPPQFTASADRRGGLLISLESAAGAQHLQVISCRRHHQISLGQFPLDESGLRAARGALKRGARRGKAGVVVRAGAGSLLERDVVLPIAAEQEAERVVGYEMDRLTPFATEEVYWAATVERRDRARGQISVRLSLVPKTAVESLGSVLSRIGTRPTAIEATTNEGVTRRIALKQSVRRPSRRTLAMAVAGVAVLGFAAAIIPFITQSLALGTVERRIAALQPQISQVQTFRRQLASGSASADVIATERARIGSTLQVLATVTDLMPDDTVLSEFTLRQGKLGISGQSRAAARLIEALAADPLIRNPSFVAPVTRAPVASARGGQVETEQVDSFSIRAELNP